MLQNPIETVSVDTWPVRCLIISITLCQIAFLYWFYLKITKSLSPQVASISRLSTFHNDTVLWCSIRPIHHYQLALRYLPHLSSLLWSPWSKTPRLYATCNEKIFVSTSPSLPASSNQNLPFLLLSPLHGNTLLENLFLSPSLVWKDIAQWWR